MEADPEAPVEMMDAMADEMEPMMQPAEKAKSEKPSSEKPASEKPLSTQADEQESDEDQYCAFCCCLCHCSDRLYRDLTCCGCFPVRCGIYCIGLLAVVLTACIFLETFMMLMSDQIAWWFVGGSVLLQIPLILGLIFFLNYFGEDTASTRGGLKSACILTLVSFGLQTAWNVAYFWGLYRFNTIIIGNDEGMFTYSCTKKQYLFWSSFAYLLAAFAFGYFVCVVGRYAYRRRDKDEEKMSKDEENIMDATMM
jgi:hypothetical protein